MSNIERFDPSGAIEEVLVKGNLQDLNPAQRNQYYASVCKSLGLNPLTKPFDYITLNGKLTLYAKRDATDQLRKIHNISISISERQTIDDVYVVTARAKNKEGREDESTGAVSVLGLKGEARANALMKAETKAKRRVTLSICGLGMLDESEVESVREVVGHTHLSAQAAPQAQLSLSPADYVARFGKYKGKRLGDVTIHELSSYVSYIEKKARDDGKEIQGTVGEFVDQAYKLIDERTPRKDRDNALDIALNRDEPPEWDENLSTIPFPPGEEYPP